MGILYFRKRLFIHMQSMNEKNRPSHKGKNSEVKRKVNEKQEQVKRNSDCKLRMILRGGGQK